METRLRTDAGIMTDFTETLSPPANPTSDVTPALTKRPKTHWNSIVKKKSAKGNEAAHDNPSRRGSATPEGLSSKIQALLSASYLVSTGLSSSQVRFTARVARARTPARRTPLRRVKPARKPLLKISSTKGYMMIGTRISHSQNASPAPTQRTSQCNKLFLKASVVSSGKLKLKFPKPAEKFGIKKPGWQSKEASWISIKVPLNYSRTLI